MAGEAKTILFLLRNSYYLRNFDLGIREICRRGHRMVILTEPDPALPTEILEQRRALQAAFPRQVSFGDAFRRRDFRRPLALELQAARTLLHYRDPRYAGSDRLRARAALRAGLLTRLVYGGQRYDDPARRERADRRLKRAQAAIPLDAGILHYLAKLRPDLLLVTPLVDLRSAQHDWIFAARALAIPTALPVASWDNLTNKSRIMTMPGRVIVWNEIQRREAETIHGVDPAIVRATGAQVYDHWFGQRPSQGREAFLRGLGLDPGRSTIVYVGSSSWIAPEEPAFVQRWLIGLRGAADPIVATANVLVRPHPFNQERYAGLALDAYGPVAVHPTSGGFPVTDAAKAEYFDALYYAGAVVGLNTSALIEAAILGKRCFTVRDPANRGGQEGTLHFHHLTGGGILREAETLAGHFDDLARELSDPEPGRADLRRFVEDFLRPHGIDRPAAPFFADAVTEPLAPAPLPEPVGVIRRVTVDALALGFYAASLASRAFGRARRRLARMRSPRPTAG